MESKHTLRPWEAALAVSLLLALIAGLWAQDTSARLQRDFVRLHVIAASDSAEDQAEKRAVRDAVLEILAPKLDGVTDQKTACRSILAARREMLSAAQRVSKHPVRFRLGTEHYPTRVYDGGFALPAGEYTSLRLVIGDGAGQNWWCVVFPPLCAAGTVSPQAVPALSREDAGLITRADGEYEIRFRVLELWDMLREAMNA